MTELPCIFDSKGRVIQLSPEAVAALPAVYQERYAKITHRAADVEAAEAAVATLNKSIPVAATAVRDMESYIAKHYPKRDFHTLWRETFQ